MADEDRGGEADDALRARDAARFGALLDGAPAWMREYFVREAAVAAWPAGIRAACAGEPPTDLLAVCHVPGGDLPTLRALVDYARPADREQAMALAIMNGVVADAYVTVRHFLDAGGDPNWRDPTYAGSSYFLSHATGPVLRLLLDRGANPDGPAGTTAVVAPIIRAAATLDDLRLLLVRGADATGAAADNAMLGSISTGRADAARLLEAYGYRPGGTGGNAADILRTGLWRALDWKADDCVCWLAEQGADLAAVPIRGDVRASLLACPELYPRTAAFLRAAAAEKTRPSG